MGCAVQLYQNSQRQNLWAANLIDGWYLQTSPEHYRCHIIHVKQTKSERVSDTVFFKMKYITYPTLTQADIITKALNDLTNALKDKNNDEGVRQLEALKQLDAILNNVPEPVTQIVNTQPTPRRVTFDETANAPAEIEGRETIPLPRLIERPQHQKPGPIHAVIIENPSHKGQLQGC